MTFVTKEELETPRQVSEIKSWVDKKIKDICSTVEGKDAVRFPRGLLKKLIEEALPLGIFCEQYFGNSEEVIITHNIGNQNHDATIDDQRANKTTLEFLEITQARDEDTHWRRVKLGEDGHVNPLGSVTKKGTKHTGITIKVENKAVERSVTINNETQSITCAAECKSGKEYPDNTGLVIICDDSIAFRDETEANNLSEFMQNEVLPKIDNFNKVFIIGWTSKVYLEFE